MVLSSGFAVGLSQFGVALYIWPLVFSTQSQHCLVQSNSRNGEIVSNVPANLSYTNEHEWVLISNGVDTYKIGITDYAQEALGDIVYIQLPKIGDAVIAGAVCGEIESTKSVSEIYSPLTGKIIAINGELDAKPEIVNSDPYGQGWIAEIQVEGALPKLLSAEQYSQITA